MTATVRRAVVVLAASAALAGCAGGGNKEYMIAAWGCSNLEKGVSAAQVGEMVGQEALKQGADVGAVLASMRRQCPDLVA